MNDKKAKSSYKLVPFMLLTLFVANASNVLVTNIAYVAAKVDKIALNVKDVFSKIDPKYKEIFLPSEYKIWALWNTSSEKYQQSLKDFGIVLKDTLNDIEITSILLENPNDNEGTADLHIEFRQRFKDMIIPISGFMKLDEKERLNLKFNDNFNADDKHNIVPSFFVKQPNYLKEFISSMPKDEKEQLKVEILYANDETGWTISKFSSQGKVIGKFIKALPAKDLVGTMMLHLKESEISKQNYESIITNFNTFNTAFYTDELYAKYKWNEDLLSLNISFNDIVSEVTYQLTYNMYKMASSPIKFVSKITSKKGAHKSDLIQETTRLSNGVAKIFYNKVG